MDCNSFEAVSDQSRAFILLCYNFVKHNRPAIVHMLVDNYSKYKAFLFFYGSDASL